VRSEAGRDKRQRGPVGNACLCRCVVERPLGEEVDEVGESTRVRDAPDGRDDALGHALGEALRQLETRALALAGRGPLKLRDVRTERGSGSAACGPLKLRKSRARSQMSFVSSRIPPSRTAFVNDGRSRATNFAGSSSSR
jgi:hypothetical protein